MDVFPCKSSTIQPGMYQQQQDNDWEWWTGVEDASSWSQIDRKRQEHNSLHTKTTMSMNSMACKHWTLSSLTHLLPYWWAAVCCVPLWRVLLIIHTGTSEASEWHHSKATVLLKSQIYCLSGCATKSRGKPGWSKTGTHVHLRPHGNLSFAKVQRLLRGPV